jgi:hypothetical protein
VTKATFLIASLLALTLTPLHAQDVTGDWQGTLKASGVELRIVVHISKNAAGNLSATFDSPDQGATGIKVGPIDLRGTKLNFTVISIDGSYQGNLNAAGTAISGTWTQHLDFPLDFQRVTTAAKTGHKPAPPSDIDGTWYGTLDTGATKLHLVFHIVNTEDGLTATMDSPDQGAKGLPVTAVTRNGATLKLEMKQLAGGFDGRIVSAGAPAIEGRWTQGGGSLALTLTRE